MRRYPWAMTTGFGFLHGLGFAGALVEVGMPGGEIPLALFSFNVGIEIGQLLFVFVVLLNRAALRFLDFHWPSVEYESDCLCSGVPGGLLAWWTGSLRSFPEEDEREKDGTGDSMVAMEYGDGSTEAAGLFWGILFPTMALAHTQGGSRRGSAHRISAPHEGPGSHARHGGRRHVGGRNWASPCIWALPIAFPMIMALGGALGILGLQIPAVEPAIVVSVIVLGTLIALAARPPVIVATAVVGIFAIFHGYAHGAELPEGVGSLAYSLGFVVSTGLLHLTGILIGLVTELPGGRQAASHWPVG